MCKSSTSLSLISLSEEKRKEKKRRESQISAGSLPAVQFLAVAHWTSQSFCFPGCWLASALSPSGSGIPCWDFHHPQSKPGSEQSHCFLVDLGRRLIWVGEGHGWAYRNAGLYTYHLQSHRTTNRDFRLGAQRAKLTFFFKTEKGTLFFRG